MALLMLPVFLLSVIIGMVMTSSRRLARRGGDEEFAHAAALLRRETSDLEHRRELRHEEAARTCTASVLGREETRTPCRVLNVSRSGMRIAVGAEFPKDTQVIVEWDSEFFVGTVCYGIQKAGEHVFGLQLVSTNYGRG